MGAGESLKIMTLLHIKENRGWNIGPDIRKCTECGTRLWLPSDGIWTDDKKVWEKPPEGYVNCYLHMKGVVNEVP